MCGIVGFTGTAKAAPDLFTGLEKLEYRGYDSSGIATLEEKIYYVKTKGRISALRNKSLNGESLPGNTGIGHTRWATHGKPSDENAHPMLSEDGCFAVVHNGIIENFAELKANLIKDNVRFTSETDTEVVPHLIKKNYDACKDVFKAIAQTVKLLKGSYALAIISIYAPNTIFAVRKDSPLVIGMGKTANYLASDIPALEGKTDKFILPRENEIAVLTKTDVKLCDVNGKLCSPEFFEAGGDSEEISKGGYAHYMLKETFEQPKVVKALASNDDVYASISEFLKNKFNGLPQKIDLIGCGSAYHAALSGKYFIEKACRIPVNCYLAGEYRYLSPITDEKTLSVVISQSGETADSLAALREATRLASPVACIVNARHSSIARESELVVFTNAGAEIAVATTKGYTTQLTSLYMLGITLLSMTDAEKSNTYKEELIKASETISAVLAKKDQIKAVAAHIFDKEDAFFIGRGTDCAPACEGALKLKEISYVHAEAYAASELKHGTISLIETDVPVIALSTDEGLESKLLSGVKEVKARGANVIAITNSDNSEFNSSCDEVIKLPKINPLFSPLASAPAMQLIGYYVALKRGCDIDKPRNLAKSVTVE